MKPVTNFQNKVYNAVKKIPKGKVMSYKKVAEAINAPRAYRAVGNALNKNINPAVPCHRVICSNGFVGGFRKGMKKKIKILKQERVKIKQAKIC